MKGLKTVAAGLALVAGVAEAQYLSTAVCSAEDVPPALCEMAQRLYNPSRFYFDPKLHNGRSGLPFIQLRRGWMNREGGWTLAHLSTAGRVSLRARFLRFDPDPFDRVGYDGVVYQVHLWGFEVVVEQSHPQSGDPRWHDAADTGRYGVRVLALWGAGPDLEDGPGWLRGGAMHHVRGATWNPKPWGPAGRFAPGALRRAVHGTLDNCLARREMRITLARFEPDRDEVGLVVYPDAVEWCDPDG